MKLELVFILFNLIFVSSVDLQSTRSLQFRPNIAAVGELLLSRPKKRQDGEDADLLFNVPAVAFGGVGFLGIYEVGALSVLVNRKIVGKRTPMYGASSGGIVTAAFCAGSSIEAMKNYTANLLTFCAGGTCPTQIDSINRAGFEDLIPSGDENVNLGCNDGNHFIHLSRSTNVCSNIADPPNAVYGQINDGGFLVSNVSTRSELIDLMLATSFIPGFSELACSTTFRGENVIDAGFTNNLPLPENGIALKITGQISSQWNGLGVPYTADVYPGIFQGVLPEGTTVDNFNNAINPLQFSNFTEALFRAGQLDMEFWVNSQIALLVQKESNERLTLGFALTIGLGAGFCIFYGTFQYYRNNQIKKELAENI